MFRLDAVAERCCYLTDGGFMVMKVEVGDDGLYNLCLIEARGSSSCRLVRY